MLVGAGGSAQRETCSTVELGVDIMSVLPAERGSAIRQFPLHSFMTIKITLLNRDSVPKTRFRES
jgi:hypothetical protein